MNIIYRLINKNKLEGKRFYIGSKQGCKVIEIDGLKTMVNVKDGKIYLGSSQSPEFKKDLINCDKFEVEILQKVSKENLKNLNEIENEWIVKLDAVNSDEYYNLGYAISKARCTETVVNKYGQTVKQLAGDNSNSSKRDNTARELGFKNYGEMALRIFELNDSGMNWAEISLSFGKHRHFAKTFVKPFNKIRAREDLLKIHLIDELRRLVGFEKCSLRKSCEILGIDEIAGRIMLGDYQESKEYTVASAMGKTKEELELQIAQMLHSGKDFREISDELGIVYESVKRYFFRYFRSRFEFSELK